MKVAFAASEVFPFAKTGGLADVAGALPKALAEMNVDVKVFLPLYSSIEREKYNIGKIFLLEEIPVKYGDVAYRVKMYKSKLPGSDIDVYFIDSPEHFAREEFYTVDADEGERFTVFNFAVMEMIQRLQWSPDIIQCNDWQTGLIPLLVKENYAWDKLFANTKTVFTIHNIAYQGIFSSELISNASLNQNHFYPQGPLEYNGEINFLKAGIVFADEINTVSDTYSREILTPEFGAGMENILKEKRGHIHGILNGVDYTEWNPEHDKYIHHNYSHDDLTGKKEIKKELLQYAGFKRSFAKPLIGMVARLVEQKGAELILDSIDKLYELDARWVILGSGVKKYEEKFVELGKQYKDKIFVQIGYDNKLSHTIEAGSDLFLMPSRYEPCGLNQIYSLKYGTVPIVRFTGGLADTVHDSEVLGDNGDTWTGFVFKEFTTEALQKAVVRALDAYENKSQWKKIMINGMNQDYSWDVSAKKYLELYQEVINSNKS